jgi:hypothetical protein
MDAVRKSIYVETTIPSYATSRPSNDIVIAGRQALTRFFWEQERHKYNLFTGQDVWDECALGDSQAAKKRLDFLEGIPVLPSTDETDRLSAIYQKLLEIPDRSKMDCSHLAVCVTAKIHHLLTWNCTHLGIVAFTKAKAYNDEHGLWTPLLVTPEALITKE